MKRTINELFKKRWPKRVVEDSRTHVTLSLLSLSVGHVSRFVRISSSPQCFYCFFLTNAVALFQSLNQHSNPQLQMPEQKKRVGWAFRHILCAGTMIETASPTFLSCITPHLAFAFTFSSHSLFVPFAAAFCVCALHPHNFNILSQLLVR